jgi:hypothetical protein
MSLTQITTGGVDPLITFTANTIYVGAIFYSNGTPFIGGSGNLPVVLDDISSRADGNTSVFNLTQDTAIINTDIMDSKDLQVVVNGSILPPYVAEQRWPWIVEYDSGFGSGFRTKGNVIIFYNPPETGDIVTMTQVSKSTSIQTRKYPFSASTIGFGD